MLVVELAEGGIDGAQTRGALAAEDGAADGGVFEFTTVGDAAEKESAAAHVAAADEVDGKEKAFSKGLEENVGVFIRANASEQHDVCVRGEQRGQRGDVLFQGFTKVRILMIDGNAGKRTELIEGDGGVGRKQAAVTGDDEGGSDTFGRMGEGPGISELAPKVQTTEEGEDLAESDGFTALQAAGEFEAGAGTEDQLGAFTAGLGRGQQKHLLHKRTYVDRHGCLFGRVSQ